MIPFALFIGDDLVLLHDNTKPHTARVTSEYLIEAGIVVLHFPPRCPDLNRIEHAWDIMGRLVRNRQVS